MSRGLPVLLVKWWSSLFRAPAPLAREAALPYLELLAYIDAHQYEADTAIELRFGRGFVRGAARLRLIRWKAPSLPDWELYRLTRLGAATLDALQKTEAQA